MKFKKFSLKQMLILTWWMENSPLKNHNGIIADGSIRAGKTLSMALSFMFWAMSTHSGQQFGMSGKTVSSFKRNVLFWLLPILRLRGYRCIYKSTDNELVISRRTKDKFVINTFYIFGGRDESSYSLIQGMTAAGWFFDEVALQPESFVNQATGRCSVEESKVWFNCNPDGPNHYFKKEFIDKAKDKGYYYIHFLMEDNPSLSEETIQRYKKSYTGVFYQRYILGLWTLAEGIIYSMFNEEHQYEDELAPEIKWRSQRYIVLDYGTTNPFAAYSVYFDNKDIIGYVDDEYYYDSKAEENHGIQKTDEEYADELIEFINKEKQNPRRIIVDPSATSFKAALRKRGLLVKDADNEVIAGIRRVSSAFVTGKLKINKKNCPNLLRELGSYIWDNKAQTRGVEQPLKINDHGPDAIRYYVNTVMKLYIDRLLNKGRVRNTKKVT